MECNVGAFWKGFPGRKNSTNKGREAWQDTYMAQLTSLSRLGALQAEPARTGHQGAAKWFWKKLGRSWSQRAGNEAPRASEVRIGSEVGDLSISISRG